MLPKLRSDLTFEPVDREGRLLLYFVLSGPLRAFDSGGIRDRVQSLASEGESLVQLFSFSAIPIISLMIFLMITAHEFAHGLACKRYGGEVHEMGFLLIYLQPAVYCNVSDAWLFAEKSKRLLVGFAGPY